jgi:hypothetical protein
MGCKLAKVLILVAGLVSVSGLGIRESQGHPFHTSLTEIDWNPESGCWEVGMRLLASDLELALQGVETNARLDLQRLDDPAVLQRLQDYIHRSCYLTHVNSNSHIATEVSTDLKSSLSSKSNIMEGLQSASELRWAGTEEEGSWIWLYFELCPSRADGCLRLVHRVLTDVNEDQMNIVSIRVGDHRYSAQTHAQLCCLVLEPKIGRISQPAPNDSSEHSDRTP